MNRNLGLNIRLADPQGATLAAFGEACGKGTLSANVERAGRVLGRVEICDQPHHGPAFLIPVIVAVLMLMAASGAIARRLVRPLRELRGWPRTSVADGSRAGFISRAGTAWNSAWWAM